MTGANGNKDEDYKWVQEFKQGNEEAFNQLVIKYQDRIFNTISRLTNDLEMAKDLTQETFINAYRGLANFRETATFFTWLFRISLNIAKSSHRQQARRKKTFSLYQSTPGEEETISLEPLSREDDPAISLEKKEQEKIVQEAIASLEEPFKSILVLRDIEQVSYEDISSILDCPIGTVRSRIHRARLMMKEKLIKLL